MKNREKSQRLLEGIGEIRESLIEDAAVLALVLLSPVALLMITWRGSGSSGSNGGSSDGTGNVYDLYYGSGGSG